MKEDAAVARFYAADLFRGFTWLWRFQTQQLAEAAFRDAEPGQFLGRPFYDYRLYLDVSRTTAQRRLYAEGTRFIAERLLLRRLVTEGMRVVDVGANIGYYALLLRHLVGDRGTVICFEPEPDNLRELERNVRCNHLDNVQIVNAAVGDRGGTTRFRRNLNGQVSDAGDLDVTIVALDDVISEPVGFIKVDVEGFEASVLVGAERMLEEHRPTLLVEIHRDLIGDHSHSDIIAFLKRYYEKLTFYDTRPEDTIAEKIRQRYLGHEALRVIPDHEQVVADFAAGRRDQPFWVTCQNQPAQASH